METGFNKLGKLLVKDMQDKIEYRLRDDSLPYPICIETYDVNEVLRDRLYNKIRQEIHIRISDKNGIIFEGKGRLKSTYEHGVEKFYLETGILTVDIEMILFHNTYEIKNNTLITIKINTLNNVDNEGEIVIDEPDENKS